MVMLDENKAKIMASSNLKFKITMKGVPISEFKPRDNTVNNGYSSESSVNNGHSSESSVLTKSCKRKPEVSVDGQRGKKREKVMPSLRRTVQKGSEPSSRSTCASADQSQSVDSTQAKCSSCGSLTCHCRPKYSSVHASISGRTSFDVQMPPKKALRDAMPKRRFADTIFKATHQVEKPDPLKMQQERERLEREKQEEKAKIESEIKDAKAASQRRKQQDLKTRREREKVATGMALQKVKPSLRNNVQKGSKPGSRSTCALADQSQSVDSTGAKCSSCGRLKCQCRPKNSSVRTSISEPCGRSACAPVDQSQSVDSTQAKCSSCGSLTCHCRPKSSSAHESISGGSSLDVEMSPKKALRAAMLKRRFADTIFKATHQVEKCDPLRMQEERERLEREKQQEKAKIEAEIKAAMEQNDLQMRREKERAAARMILQKIEKTVEIYENIYILKDLEMLCCGSVYGVEDAHSGNPLERLGLYLKDDYLEEDEDAILDLEEGEILS